MNLNSTSSKNSENPVRSAIIGNETNKIQNTQIESGSGIGKKRKIQYLKYANDADPFNKKKPLVKWAPRFSIDSPDDDDAFPDLICATQFHLGSKACSTPNILVSIDITGVSRMDCSYCNQRVKRGLFLN